MNISSVIRAPWAVQVYRCFFAAFLVYVALALHFYPVNRYTPFSGIVVICGLSCFSFFGLLATFIRASWARWFLACFGIWIPAILLGVVYFHDTDKELWDWFLSAVFMLMWLSVPFCGALMLFRHDKTRKYFTGLTA